MGCAQGGGERDGAQIETLAGKLTLLEPGFISRSSRPVVVEGGGGHKRMYKKRGVFQMLGVSREFKRSQNCENHVYIFDGNSEISVL